MPNGEKSKSFNILVRSHIYYNAMYKRNTIMSKTRCVVNRYLHSCKMELFVSNFGEAKDVRLSSFKQSQMKRSLQLPTLKAQGGNDY